MGEYTNFQDCLDKNQDKIDPAAYCGKIKSEVEKECLCKMRVLKAADGRFIIYGPASVEVRDREGDKIRAAALHVALPQLLKRGRFSRNHEDILVGEILSSYESEGKIYKTGVIDDKLMVVGEIWGDTRAGRETQQGIIDKKLRSYSISGEALDVQKVCDSSGCYRDISKLDLHAVTICENGMNQAAHFSVIQKGDILEYEYLTIATPKNNVNEEASAIAEEVLKANMTEDKTKPPAVEAKKQDAAPPEAGGGGGTDAKLDKIIALLESLAGGMGKAVTPPATPEVAKAPDVPAPEKIQVAITKADIEAILDEKLKVIAAGTTPRPIMKEQLGGTSPLDEIMKDPSRLDKMSFKEISDLAVTSS